MKRIELEKKFQQLATEIEESDLIKKCQEIAIQQGRITLYDEGSAHTNINRRFLYENLLIKYDIHGWGNKDLRVYYKDDKVFVISKVVTKNPAKNHILTVSSGNDTYGVCFFKPGEWKSLLLSLYDKMLEEVSEEELKNLKDKLGDTFLEK